MKHVLALSGGKDSTALAIYMRDHHPDLAMEYCFADTGRELPDVYRFLDELEIRLGKPIERLTDYGRKFDYYLDRWGWYLPGNGTRWCTKHLKIRPFERFVRGHSATIYIGLRADEGRDENYGTPGVVYRYPFKEDGVDLSGVRRILSEARVQLPDFYKWRSTGGCWMCPWQRPRDWKGLKKNHPDLFDQAVEEEKKASHTTGRKTTWSVSLRTVTELVEKIDAQPSLFPELGDYDDEDAIDERPCLICAK